MPARPFCKLTDALQTPSVPQTCFHMAGSKVHITEEKTFKMTRVYTTKMWGGGGNINKENSSTLLSENKLNNFNKI